MLHVRIREVLYILLHPYIFTIKNSLHYVVTGTVCNVDKNY